VTDDVAQLHVYRIHLSEFHLYSYRGCNEGQDIISQKIWI
jgi:hypothetical protein